jgi:hypothetical protein
MKNSVIKSLYIFSAALLLSACGQNEKPKEMYCGLGMSAFEVIDAKSMAANFKYTDSDKALLAVVTDEVTSVAGDKPTEVYFFNRDDKFIGIYVVAPDDKALVEKISCALLQSSSAALPETRKIVFYTNQSNNLVAAVKTKPKA